MIKLRDYDLKEFVPSPESVGFIVHKDNKCWGALISKANQWQGYAVEDEKFILINCEDMLEIALEGVEAAYGRAVDNVIDFLKYKERKSGVC